MNYLPNTIKDPRYDVYVKRTLGRYLPECLQEITEVKPRDPIQFLAHWLYRSMESECYIKEKAEYLRELQRNQQILDEEALETHEKLQPLRDAAQHELALLSQARIEEMETLMDLLLRFGEDALDEYTISRLGFFRTMYGDEMLQARDNLLERRRQERIQKMGFDDGSSDGSFGFTDLDSILSKTGKGISLTQPSTDLEPIDESLTDYRRASALRMKDSGKYRWGSTEEEEDNEDDLSAENDVEMESLRKILQGLKEGESRFEMTHTGSLALISSTLGIIVPKTAFMRAKETVFIDQPSEWHKRDFHCNTFYDHELYTLCDTDKGPAVYRKSMAKMTVKDFLTPLNTAFDFSEDDD